MTALTAISASSSRDVVRYAGSCGLILGADAVAVDATGARAIQACRRQRFGEERLLTPPASHIVAADRQYGLGVSDPARIEVVTLGWQDGALLRSSGRRDRPIIEAMEASRQVLVVGASNAEASAVFQRFSRVLSEAGCEVHRAPPGNEALTLMQSTGFDLILVGFPIVDPPIRELLRSVRWRESACRNASLLVVVLESMAEAQELLQRGVNKVIRIEAPEEELRQAVRDLLAVAPRVALRTTLRLAIKRERGVERAVAQTDNVSISGMLVRGSQTYPRGAVVQFEFLLPGQPTPIAGEGVVVRGTAREREAVRGCAVRFVSFTGDGRQRLEGFLESHAGAT